MSCSLICRNLFSGNRNFLSCSTAHIANSPFFIDREYGTKCRPRVLITHPSVPKVGIQLLCKKKIEVIKTKCGSRKEILEKVKGVDALFWASLNVKLDKEILDCAGCKMKTVGLMGIGYDHLDICELKKRGISVGYTADIGLDAIADVAIMLMIAAARRLTEARKKIECNKWHWHWQWLLGQEVTGSIVGILGLGSIGMNIVKRLKGFKVKKFLYTDLEKKPEAKCLGAKCVPLKTLLKCSDFVICCLPLTKKTRCMLNKECFDRMKENAVFVNVSRGGIVETEGLVCALKQKKIFAAGLDVMDPEPLPAGHDLLCLPNVVLLPHLASATRPVRDCMSLVTAQNIIKVLLPHLSSATKSVRDCMSLVTAKNIIKGIKGEKMPIPLL